MTLYIGPHSSNASALVTMPHPKGNWTDNQEEIGGTITTPASTFRDVFDRRRVWTFTWEAITSACLTTIRNVAIGSNTLDLRPPEAASNVTYMVVSDGGIRTTAVHTGTPGTYRWNVSWSLRET